MTLLLSCQTISKTYGSRELFKDISFGIFKGDKIGLMGPNAAGKSTLLKILAGLETADEGTVTTTRSAKIGYVPQESTFPDKTIEEILHEALSQSHHAPHEYSTHINIIMSQMGFTDTSLLASSLSGGWKKRLDIARILIQSPDVILLDEPTNHLDLEGTLWLEKFLQSKSSLTYLLVSHDRYFLEHVTERMIEINRVYPKGIFCAEGSYSVFLEKRDAFISGQKQQEHSLSSKVRREIEWLKQNPKARTTKSTARIQDAHELIGELNALKSRNKGSSNQIDFTGSERQTHKLLVATNLSMTFGERLLFSHLNLTLSPGTRIGIVGLNGSGKTTLLRLLAGELQPDKGTIKRADELKIVYFDQHRTHLPPDISLRRALAPGNDTVLFRGRSIHVNAWCKRFLFSPDRLDLPFNRLSGGERARVHMARLMLQPADILLLDEPTNDLDIPTLEILEESLSDFPGAIVLISHDRYMLDRLSNVILALGSGVEGTLFADYRQWEEMQLTLEAAKAKANAPVKEQKNQQRSDQPRSQKMTFSEKFEWEQMEGKILAVEKQIDRLSKDIEGKSGQELKDLCAKLEAKQAELETLFTRWAELESKTHG